MPPHDDFGPLHPRPENWAAVFAITSGLRGIPITLIERGRVDWEYEFDPVDQRPCGREGCEQRHAHGFVVALPGGRYVNIGNDCARKYANSDLWSGRVDAYRQRVQASARDRAIGLARDVAQAKQHWLDNHAGVAAAISLYESFVAAARGPLLDEIRQRAEKGKTRIEKERRLSEEERETRRAMLNGTRHPDQPPIPVPWTETTHLGDLRGLRCFRVSQDPRYLRTRLEKLIETLLLTMPVESDKEGVRQLIEATNGLAPLANDFSASLVAINEFSSEANLRSLMRLEVTKSQGVISIHRASDVLIVQRRPNWNRSAA